MNVLGTAAIPLALTALAALLIGVAIGILIGRRLRSAARSPDAPSTDAIAADESPTAALSVAAPGSTAVSLSGVTPPSDRAAGPGSPAPDVRTQLAAAEERITELVGRLESETKRHHIEYGRLESAALAALDGAIVAGDVRADELAAALDEMRSRMLAIQGHLDYMTSRSETLERSLAERDTRVAEVTAALENGRRE